MQPYFTLLEFTVVLDGTLTEEEFTPRLKWRLSIYRVASLVLHDTQEEWADNMETALQFFNEIVPKAEDRDERFFQRMLEVRVQAALHHASAVDGREFVKVVDRLFATKARRSTNEAINRYHDHLAEIREKVGSLCRPHFWKLLFFGFIFLDFIFPPFFSFSFFAA